MKYFQVIVVAALAVSLIINFTFFSKLESIEHRINNISHSQDAIMSSVNGQSSHIHNVMEEIRSEQSWIGYISVDVDTRNIEEVGRGNAIFEWQIKELPTDAEVVLNYSIGKSDTYISVPAEEIQTGKFQAVVPFELTLEPHWEIMRHFEETVNEYEVVEKERGFDHDTEIKYFVSMSSEGMVKSGSEEITNLEDFGTRYYGYIMVDISSHDDNLFINVNSDYFESGNTPEEVYLLVYENGQILENVQLKSDEYGDEYTRASHFHLERPIKEGSYTNLVLRVVYSNGEVFEKEVY